MSIRKRVLSLFVFIFISCNILCYGDYNFKSQNETVVEIISINDFHGNLSEDAREKGKNMGMAKVIDAVKKYKANNPNTIVVSAGDSYQGSAMSNLTHGAPVSEMYKEMGVIASAVGNHEFDWGIEWVEKWKKDGEFDFLATNIIEKKSGKPVDWAKPYKIVDINGIKIGFIGLTTPETEFKTLPENVKDYKFESVKKSAEEWVKKLKDGDIEEGKVDAVIALTHIGSFQDRETKEISGEVIESSLVDVKGLDGIITGHTHQSVAGTVNGIPIVQGYKYGRALGKLTLSFDSSNKLVKSEAMVDLLYSRKGELSKDQQGNELYMKYEDELRPILDEVIASTNTELSHERHGDGGVTVLGKWTTDVMRELGDTQIAVTNEGGLRTSIPKGDITVGKLYEVMPFDNTLITMDLTGAQLKRVIENGILNKDIGWIEISGAKVYYDKDKEVGARISAIILDNGEEVKMEKTYSVCTNDFMYAGGDKYDFSGATNVRDTNKPIRDMVIEYLRNEKEVKVEFEQPLIAGEEPTKVEENNDNKNKGNDENKPSNDKNENSNNQDGSGEKAGIGNLVIIVIILFVAAVILTVVINKTKKNENK